MSADPNQQLSIYPLIENNGWKFFPLPFLRKDVEKAMESIKTFNSRKNDVLFCTGLKTGTHWVHEILSMLLNHTTEFNTLFDTLQLQLENPLDYNFAETISELRLIHTHFPIECLPTKHLEMGAKIVYVNRNPKDRAVSLYHFLSGKIGFPDMSWEEFFNEFILNDKLYGGWFNYTKGFTEAMQIKSTNICPVVYEELLLDPTSNVTRLAEFLGVPNNVDFITKVVESCSFENLKDKKKDATRMIHPEGKSTIFRKGKIGDWKNLFTVAQSEKFDERYNSEMKDCNIQFIYESTK